MIPGTESDVSYGPGSQLSKIGSADGSQFVSLQIDFSNPGIGGLAPIAPATAVRYRSTDHQVVVIHKLNVPRIRGAIRFKRDHIALDPASTLELFGLGPSRLPKAEMLRLPS
jgi:hypothetical protein